MVRNVFPGLRRMLGSDAPPQRSRIPGLKCDYLRDVDIFRDLSADDLRRMSEVLPETTVRRGQVVYHQEDRAEALFLLKKGRIRLSRVTASGKRLDIAVLGPGTFFGEMPLLGESMRNTQAEAIEDSTLCVMSRADIEQLIMDRPAVALRMLHVIGCRMRDAEARLEDLAYRSASARLASLLLRLAEETGSDEIAGFSHQDLGDMIGAYRETVTKTLDDFQEEGWVELGRKRVRLRHRPALAALLDE